MSRFRVSELGALAGVSADTIRYYDRLGLVPAPERTESGYRIYDDAALDRLRLIRQAQSMGLRLAQIGELLATLDGGDCPCQETVAAMRARHAEVDAEISRLEDLRAQLGQAIERVEADPNCEPCAPGPCLPEVLRPREEVIAQ